MREGPLNRFLESLVEVGSSRDFSDAGVARLLSIYRTHDIQPPVTLQLEAEWRGIPIPMKQDRP